MSAEEQEPVGEERSDRAARIVLTFVGGLAAWGMVAAFPWIAYVVSGVLLTLTVQRVTAWRDRRRQNTTETDDVEDQEAEEPDVVTALHHLAGKDRGVLLTGLRDHLALPDTKAVKALLEQAGIPTRAGVRTGAGNGPGVHRDDIPALPSPTSGTPVGGCSCTSEANANTNNGDWSVERVGASGRIVRDPADAQRRHKVA